MRQGLLKVIIVIALATLCGCTAGPDYRRPSVAVPPAFKELEGWREARPRDREITPAWWTVFNDPLLNSLEEQAAAANQSLAQAEAQYRQAQALVRGARARYSPVVNVSASASRSRSTGIGGIAGTDASDQYSLPLDASWEADLWGRIRRTVESSAASAQASAADFQGLRLSLQAAVAQNYFQLRTLDTQKAILDETAAAFSRALELTNNRYKAGVAAKADVVLAMTQLQSAQAQALDVGVQRAQFEHAIASLIGKPPSDLSIPPAPLAVALPPIPVGIPSDILERRPDIASAERRMAAANAQIGVAQAAYFPSLTLSASAGYQGTNVAGLFSAPSFFWALGPAVLAQNLFDGGARRAQTDQALASYDASVAAYRQTVLTGFQEVEDNLAAVRILADEALIQEEVVRSARESVSLTTNQYKAGIVSYLNVITTQAIALTNERAAAAIRGQRFNAAVLLIKALGGGWDGAQLADSGQSADGPAGRDGKAVGDGKAVVPQPPPPGQKATGPQKPSPEGIR